MTVSARAANDSTGTANTGFVDMRDGTSLRAGTYAYDGVDLVTGWHTHDLHQIEYAMEGVAEVETATARYLLPPQQAMWIPAGCAHTTTLKGVRSVAAFFAPETMPALDDRARVLAADPVLREMMIYAARWPIGRGTSDPSADVFFDALAIVTLECLDHEAPLSLPTSRDPIISAVMQYTQDHLGDATVRDVSRAIGVSERTLRRRFSNTGMTWSEYLLASRMLRATALLTETHRSITEVSIAVGFDSVSAFTRAFRRYCGETPSRQRQRMQRARPADQEASEAVKALRNRAS